MPIVRVHERGRRVLARSEFQRGPDEHREPQRVVRIVGAVHAVERGAIEEVGTVDEPGAGAVGERRLHERDVAGEAAHGHRKLFDDRPVRHAAVLRQREDDVPAEARDRRRQRAEHVGQTTGLRERQRFRADDQHARFAIHCNRLLAIHSAGSARFGHRLSITVPLTLPQVRFTTPALHDLI